MTIATLDRKKETSNSEQKNGLYKTDTDVSKHLIENLDHRIDFNNVNILAHSNNWRKLLIKETLLIQNQKPSLNIEQSSILYIYLTCIVN